MGLTPKPKTVHETGVTSVEEEVVGQSPVELGYRIVALEVEIFIFERVPEAFNEDVVQGSAGSIPRVETGLRGSLKMDTDLLAPFA